MAKAPQTQDIDYFGADRFSALGDVPVIIQDVPGWEPPGPPIQAVCIGVDRAGALPAVDPARFDLLLTIAPRAPAPWVSIAPDRLDEHLRTLEAAVRGWPVAATALCAVLRITQAMPFGDALAVESYAYSALLGGSEFRRWHSARGALAIPAAHDELVLIERDADVVTLTLNDPGSCNAMTAAMRDALHAALTGILDDPSEPRLVLRGAGRCFSTGGALGEFGSAGDLAQAHVIRTLRSCAALLDAIGERAKVCLHGACVGSGLEIPAAARHRAATQDAWFQLPELRMGLIPGAGGTASVARAIGRHRTAWMVLSGKRLSATQALAWGLIHEIAP
ncbi:enoyl-CoA hydratase/isomerase family protein [Blastomonas sp.]|uniref:enoyl-CoA hydratase/isomerase family protein n=1 Tax=Blastomonas sp. TaxID=1909299 RepID=UPI0039193E87